MQSLSFKFLDAYPLIILNTIFLFFFPKVILKRHFIEKKKSKQNNNFMAKSLSLGSSLKNAQKEN